jgi:hypothetical protein
MARRVDNLATILSRLSKKFENLGVSQPYSSSLPGAEVALQFLFLGLLYLVQFIHVLYDE